MEPRDQQDLNLIKDTSLAFYSRQKGQNAFSPEEASWRIRIGLYDYKSSLKSKGT